MVLPLQQSQLLAVSDNEQTCEDADVQLAEVGHRRLEDQLRQCICLAAFPRGQILAQVGVTVWAIVVALSGDIAEQANVVVDGGDDVIATLDAQLGELFGVDEPPARLLDIRLVVDVGRRVIG